MLIDERVFGLFVIPQLLNSLRLRCQNISGLDIMCAIKGK